MLRRWFLKRLPTPDACRSQLAGAFNARALEDPGLWHPNRRSVAGAVALGLFVGWQPVPGQMLIAGVLAAVLRVHVPISVVMVWFTNPLTFVPLGYVAWRVGSMLLGKPAPAEAVAFDASIGQFAARLQAAWPELLVGTLFCGAASAVAGFFTVLLLWRILAVRRWRTRRHRTTPERQLTTRPSPPATRLR